MSGDSDQGPWAELDETGASLVVQDFLTKRLSTLMSTLRREVTLPYARGAGLSIVEWRLLSLVGHDGMLPFGELVTQSTSDKAQVSRNVRQLERQGLVEMRPETETSRKKLLCAITPKGLEVYERVMREARRAQAKALLILSREERAVLFKAIERLQASLDG